MVMVMITERRPGELRKSRRLSHGDLECNTGLLQCCTSRVENGHTFPRVEAIERYAIGREVPLVAFFAKSGGPPPPELLLASEIDDRVRNQRSDFPAIRPRHLWRP
jgi:transcriptional regulator with XRE-family HTH domain